MALLQKFFVGAASALPRDVRRRLCLAVEVCLYILGYALVRPLAK